LGAAEAAKPAVEGDDSWLGVEVAMSSQAANASNNGNRHRRPRVIKVATG